MDTKKTLLGDNLEVFLSVCYLKNPLVIVFS